MTDYIVTLNEPGPYRIGVDYEIPTKSIQYGNIILDELNAQFTGRKPYFWINIFW